jgi:hypothetical protein
MIACGAVAPVSWDGPVSADSPASSAAVVPSSVEAAALCEAYRREGGGRDVIFVEVSDGDADVVDDIVRRLRATLGVTVRRADEADRSDPERPALTPVDPRTGEPGVVLRVDAVLALSGDRVRVVVTYARSGLDGGVLSMTLTRDGADWAVTAVEPSPA